MNLFALFSLIAFILFLQAVFYLLFIDKKIRDNKAFATICFVMAIYAFFTFLLQITESEALVKLYYRFSSIGRASIPTFLTYFFFRLSKSKNLVIINLIRYFLLPLYILIIVKFLIVDIASIKHFHYEDGIWVISPIYTTPWFYFSLINFLACAIISMIIIIRWMFNTNIGREKLISRHILSSTAFFASIILFTYYFASAYDLTFISASTPLIVALCIGLFYYFLVKLKHDVSSPEILNFLIIEQMKDFVLFLDFDRKIVSANKFLFSTLGYNIYDIHGVPAIKLFQNHEIISKICDDSHNNDISDSDNNHIISKTNELFPVYMSCLLNKDSFGNIIGYVLVCTDIRQTKMLKQEISERVEHEKELVLIKTKLESLVERKTKELFEANEKLKNEIYERNRAEEQIKTDLNKKISLVQEIHHRVKNNIQMVISLINMQSADSNIDSKSSMSLKELSDKVRSISTVHEDFYSLPRLSKINFGAYLKKTTGELYSHNKKDKDIIFRLNIVDEPLDIDKAIPCGIIYMEILTNSIKYAFPKNKKKYDNEQNIIEVEFFKKNDKYNLIVNDNGVGMKLQDTKNNEKAIGLHLVEILVDKHLKGSYNITDSEGTRFLLEF